MPSPFKWGPNIVTSTVTGTLLCSQPDICTFDSSDLVTNTEMPLLYLSAFFALSNVTKNNNFQTSDQFDQYYHYFNLNTVKHGYNELD